MKHHWPVLCAAAAVLAACAAEPPAPAPVAAFEAQPRDRCAVARAEDFRGAGAADLQRYARTLARERAAGVGLAERDVSLAVSDAEPKPGPVGVIAGEFSCGSGGDGPPFRITLYRKALEGRPLQVAYHTVAHELQHIVQVRRDSLRCHGSDAAAVERYEREAMDVAGQLVPECR
jgi:hypothetical protein